MFPDKSILLFGLLTLTSSALIAGTVELNLYKEGYKNNEQASVFEDGCEEAGVLLSNRIEVAKARLGLSNLDDAKGSVEAKLIEGWNGHSPVIYRHLECNAFLMTINNSVSFKQGSIVRKGENRLTLCQKDLEELQAKDGSIYENLITDRKSCSVAYIAIRRMID